MFSHLAFKYTAILAYMRLGHSSNWNQRFITLILRHAEWISLIIKFEYCDKNLILLTVMTFKYFHSNWFNCMWDSILAEGKVKLK